MTTSDCVAFTGPPPVSRKIVEKSFTQKIVIRIQLMYVDREIIGKVTFVRVFHLLAPSTLAASYTLLSTDARAAAIIVIIKGKLIQTLKTQTVICASKGLARKRTLPNPNASARIGIGLWGVATSQFHEVAETTTGTTQGSRSSTLNPVLKGIRVFNRSASARPTNQLPNTPTSVKITVKRVAAQKTGSVSTCW